MYIFANRHLISHANIIYVSARARCLVLCMGVPLRAALLMHRFIRTRCAYSFAVYACTRVDFRGGLERPQTMYQLPGCWIETNKPHSMHE